MKKKMTKASIAAIAFIVSIPLGLMAQDDSFYPYSYARLSYVNGTVFVQRASDLGYEKGEINLALIQGDKLGTESGQAEIHFGRRNYLRIDDNTKIEFAVLPTEGDERIKLHLTEGSAYLRVSRLAIDKGIEVHTPDASFYVLEEGLYRFDVRLDRETEASVREGSLEAAAEDGSVLVRENESVTAAGGRLLGDPAYAVVRQDGFDTWNASRDGQLAARGETRYLPSEIEEYEDELDQNGEWVYERGYGNVWVPHVTYADWRPYLYGRWVWYPVIGWTWVSSEPWGWSVYHYGRWHWRFGLGWYWIPRHHWGPAWVHWWWDNDHIGWCPLSWYDRPVLIVNNRFYDRYYDRYFSAHNRALTVVRRDQLQARDLHRRVVGAAERDRIGQVELRRAQPSIRPAVDNAKPQALAAKRAFADRPGSRHEVKSVAPSNALSPSRMRPGAIGAGGSRDRNVPAGPTDRGALARPSVRGNDPGDRALRPSIREEAAGGRGSDAAGRAIRSYPSQRTAVSRDQARASDERRSPESATVRRGGNEARDPGAKVSRPEGRASEPQTKVSRETPRAKNEGQGSSGGTIRSNSSSGRSQSRASASRSAVSRAPSRLSSPPSSSARSSAPSVSRPSTSSRPSSRSSSRPSVSSRSSSSPSRSSYSTPSRSGGSSGRSVSAPRSSPSSGRSISAPRSSGSSSGRSVSAPRSSSSSGRSVSAPRSGGSSSSRSSSSGRSGSSSSRSSGSSSRSGSVKRKS